ncbi:hypothetical protein DUNSADRAFT_15265 [Dunaliella salina]|uniref:Encoded protein n=1 Tax=Dunaliella salina TaxID=3046 RepID=A0ABQ7FZA6_DUNSA|nr:hypothetical protein DUNSADRAFT_15265 [Dunaliella salina]|eukprot:KAF5829964.1 hypothetical protein DUNSADRAFT_15265 [Dunaliella salina]
MHRMSTPFTTPLQSRCAAWRHSSQHIHKAVALLVDAHHNMSTKPCSASPKPEDQHQADRMLQNTSHTQRAIASPFLATRT